MKKENINMMRITNSTINNFTPILDVELELVSHTFVDIHNGVKQTNIYRVASTDTEDNCAYRFTAYYTDTKEGKVLRVVCTKGSLHQVHGKKGAPVTYKFLEDRRVRTRI